MQSAAWCPGGELAGRRFSSRPGDLFRQNRLVGQRNATALVGAFFARKRSEPGAATVLYYWVRSVSSPAAMQNSSMRAMNCPPKSSHLRSPTPRIARNPAIVAGR